MISPVGIIKKRECLLTSKHDIIKTLSNIHTRMNRIHIGILTKSNMKIDKDLNVLNSEH